MSEVIAICKSTAVSKIKEFLFILFGYQVALFSIGKISIHVFPVNTYHTRRVLCLFHTAFDLKRIQTTLRKLRDMVDRTQILWT